MFRHFPRAALLIVLGAGCSGSEGGSEEDAGGADSGGSAGTGGGSGATGGASSAGKSSGTAAMSGSTSSDECGGAPVEVQGSCTALCDAVETVKCDHLELMVPYVYGVYSLNPNGEHTGCAERCATGVGTGIGISGRSRAPERCGREVVALVDCLASGSCSGLDGDLTLWEASCESEVDALLGCAQTCMDLPTCSASACNGQMCAEGVCCTWQCGGPSNRVCEQTCN